MQEHKIVSPISFFNNSIWQKNLVDHIESDLLLNTEVLIFGMSYSLRGIDKELIKNKCFDFSWHSLDLYYNYKLFLYAKERGKIKNIKCSFLIFPYYYFNYDMSKSKKQYDIATILAVSQLKDKHNRDFLLDDVHNYEACEELFGENILNFYHSKENIYIYDRIDSKYKEKLGAIWTNVHKDTIDENEKIYLNFLDEICSVSDRVFLIVPPAMISAIDDIENIYKMKTIFESAVNKKNLKKIDMIDMFSDKKFQNENLFCDAFHLNYEGAKVFTEVINNIIAEFVESKEVIMKICGVGLNRVYFRDTDGDITGCSWTDDGYFGNIFEQSFDEIYHGERANRYRERLMAQDYSKCLKAHCPYCAKGTVDSVLVDVDEVPKYPDHLYLSFENVCNYNCPSCTVHCMMEANKGTDLEKKYQYIEDQIRPMLPHLKFISANGLGELFVSKHILKLLSDWKPLAPKEECTVVLETNGSLFNAENFKKIENLGQYNLKVHVTVMSFDEHVYQVLSGTKLPITTIEANLRYIKSLREQGIINYLELATVVQERNFRTLPELTKRFIEEFGADQVRLRPYTPWGRFDKATEWFADIGNPYHPYYEEYLEVMKDPIFKHPKVNDWGGGNDSEIGEHPYKYGVYNAQIMSQMIINKDSVKDKIKAFSKKFAVYGVGIMGKTLIDFMKDENCIQYAIDKYANGGEYSGCPIVNLEDCEKVDKDVDIIVSIMYDNRIIDEQLEKAGYDPKRIVRIDELII